MITRKPTSICLRKLTLIGDGVPDATIEFARGLNIIVGPSDTGKTYVAECIDFMFGGSTPPKAIPEASRYESLQLSLESEVGDTLILERSLLGGNFRVHRNGREYVLKSKHSPTGTDTVSHLFLTMVGLAGRRVQKNVAGETRTLSFRDIARLVIVTEKEIIADRSPIHTGQNTSRTVESSVFRILLSGVDDSSLVQVEEPGVARVKKLGRVEVLQELLDKIRYDLQRAEASDISVGKMRARTAELERYLVECYNALASHRASISELESERKKAWEALRAVDSQEAVLRELQKRFRLLQEQYESDLRRLEAIGEVETRLAQLAEKECPICGAVAEHQVSTHRYTPIKPQEVSKACNAEAEKLLILARELARTIDSNEAKLADIGGQLSALKTSLSAMQERLNIELQPRIARLLADIRGSENEKSRLVMILALHNRREELAKMLDVAETPAPRIAVPGATIVGADVAEAFCRVMEAQLRSWNFPNLDRVTFSERDQDVVISGRRRSSHGKGVRAITHAAFTLAMLKYCRQVGKSHPGLALIDSPLVAYHAPKPEAQDTVDAKREKEAFTRGQVKEAFYRNVANDFAAEQVIVLENEEPPVDLVGVNVIRFTGTDLGRSGFLSAL